jgi:hypothetical protein
MLRPQIASPPFKMATDEVSHPVHPADFRRNIKVELRIYGPHHQAESLADASIGDQRPNCWVRPLPARIRHRLPSNTRSPVTIAKSPSTTVRLSSSLELAAESCRTNDQTASPAKARNTKPALHRKEGEFSYFFFA